MDHLVTLYQMLVAWITVTVLELGKVLRLHVLDQDLVVEGAVNYIR